MIALDLAQIDLTIAQFFLPFVRILALIAVVPVLGNRAIPARLKVGLAALITVASAPLLPPPTAIAVDSWLGFVLVAREVMIGIALGLMVRIIFAAIELAGDIIGLQMGLSFAGYVDPGSSSGTAVAAFLRTIAVLLFLSIDGHLLLVIGVTESFERIPIALDNASFLQARKLLALASQMFVIALSLALPIIVILLIANLGLGVISRVAPQLNMFAVSFPLTLFVGLGALMLVMPYLASPLVKVMERGVSWIATP